MNEIMRKFDDLCLESQKVLDETYDTIQVEPSYLRLLSLLKNNPEFKSIFVVKLLFILDKNNAPWEIIQFCMRELQWNEIKQEIETRLRVAEDLRMVAILNHILEVYDKEWVDADLYKYYSTEAS